MTRQTNVIKKIFGFIIFFNILSFTNINHFNIVKISYFLKFIFPIILFVYLVIKNLRSQKKITLQFLKIIGLIFLISTLLFISSLLSPLIVNSFIESISLIIMLLISLVLIPNYLSDISDRNDILRHINKIYVLTILLVISYSVILNQDIYYFSGDRKRYLLAFTNPNALGAFVFMTGILSLYNYITSKKNIFILSYIFSVALSYLSDSRTSMYTLIIVTVIFHIFYTNKLTSRFISKNKKNILISVFSITIVLFIVLFQRFDYNKVNLLTSGRLNAITYNLKNMTFKDKVFGTGFGSAYENPHNGYLMLYVEGGAILTLIILSLTIYLTIRGSNNKLKLFMVGLLVFSLFESTYFTVGNINSVVFWLMSGFMISLRGE